MASTTEKPTVPESQTEPAMRAEVRTETTKSACEHFREYARERPGIVALWCFGLGFVVGWKLKLW